MKDTILVTGATSGFGRAIAEKYAKNGYQVIINGRRVERLHELKKELENRYDAVVYELPFDVRNRKAVFAAIDSLPENWKNIDILVNNAGLALGTEGFQDCDIEDWETMIDTNVKGMLYVSRAVIPVMMKNKHGHIVNIGSTAGIDTYPGGNVYCATKRAVHAISDGTRMDLVKYGIKVTEICPGMAETEFSIVRYKGDKNKADNVYNGVKPLVAEDIAEITYFATSALAQHVEIRSLVVSPQQQAGTFVIDRH